MGTQLTTHWSEHDAGLATILRSLSTSLLVFDEDLVRLGLECPENIEILRRFLVAGKRHRIRIVVKNAAPLRNQSPRLFQLLATYPEQMTVVQCPQHLHSLNDAQFIVNETHALIRFHRDSARSRARRSLSIFCWPPRSWKKRRAKSTPCANPRKPPPPW